MWKPTANSHENWPEYPKSYSVGYLWDSAEGFATNAHNSTNHLYDDYLPYHFHLRMSNANYIRFQHLVDKNWKPMVESGIWLHDVIENTRTTYSQIVKWFGEDVADIVYALTPDRGKNRKGRESDKCFEDIRNTPYATFAKLCERIANVEYSKMTSYKSEGKHKLEMYKKEYPRFKEQLYDKKYKEMFDYLEQLLGLTNELSTLASRKEQNIAWNIPSKDAGADGSLRAGYAMDDLTEALNFIEKITHAPVVTRADEELNKEAEKFLTKYLPK